MGERPRLLHNKEKKKGLAMYEQLIARVCMRAHVQEHILYDQHDTGVTNRKRLSVKTTKLPRFEDESSENLDTPACTPHPTKHRKTM